MPTASLNIVIFVGEEHLKTHLHCIIICAQIVYNMHISTLYNNVLIMILCYSYMPYTHYVLVTMTPPL